jgi:hypothetical protein
MLIRNVVRLLAAAGEEGGGGGKAEERDPKSFGDEVEEQEEELDEDGNPIVVEEAEEEELEKDEKADKDKPIPGKRAAEMVAKAEKRAKAELQSQLDELKAQLQAATGGGRRASPVQQLRLMEQKKAELEDKYEELMVGGKKEELPAVRRELKHLETAIVDYKVELRATAAQSGAAEDVRYQVALDIMEERYPELNPEHDDYDKDREDEVSDLVDGLVAKGIAKDVALKRAVKYVLGERKGGKKEEGDDDPKLARTIAARKRAAEAARRTPANGEVVGRTDTKGDENKIDMTRKITPEVFAKFGKLDEKERARLRGDSM